MSKNKPTTSEYPKPCSASCRGHVSHSCERCGLQWAPTTPQERQQIADLKAKLAEAEREKQLLITGIAGHTGESPYTVEDCITALQKDAQSILPLLERLAEAELIVKALKCGCDLGLDCDDCPITATDCNEIMQAANDVVEWAKQQAKGAPNET
jgi:hypothetical protein